MFEQRHSGLHDADFDIVEEPRAEPRIAASPARPEGFQLPRGIWLAMFALYAIFIGALALAAGGSAPARFALVVAALFILVYFATASILARLGGPDREQAGPARPLQTICGPLAMREVWVQVLVIPAALAGFGIAALIVVGLAGA